MGEHLTISPKRQEAADIILHAEIAAPEKIRSVSLIINGDVYQKIKPDQAYWQVDLPLGKDALSAGGYFYLRIQLEDENIILGSPIWIK